jgi:acetate kinase
LNVTNLERILVVNAGSSSVKLSLLDASDKLLESIDLSSQRGRIDSSGIEAELADLGGVDAVGHRVVHGGTEFDGPVVVDQEVRHRLEMLTDLAPLHQPRSLAAIDLVSGLLPNVPAVACFDTAFHQTMPDAAATYALPREWRARWDLRRFGFHGLSHAYASRWVPQLLGRSPDGLRLVSCHLGSGASLAAIRDGHSVDTTMGFTPLEGLVMATRSGSVDPGLVLWLQEHVGIPTSDLALALENRSGLFGLAGTPDMREVLAAEVAGDAAAELALSVYLHRLRAGIGAMTASLGGLDCLVFTGGVGEHSSAIRRRATEGLEYLGVRLDADRNDAVDGDANLTGVGSAVHVLVVTSREDLEIARGVREALGGEQDSG